jgi:hypothetical protein
LFGKGLSREQRSRFPQRDWLQSSKLSHPTAPSHSPPQPDILRAISGRAVKAGLFFINSVFGLKRRLALSRRQSSLFGSVAAYDEIASDLRDVLSLESRAIQLHLSSKRFKARRSKSEGKQYLVGSLFAIPARDGAGSVRAAAACGALVYSKERSNHVLIDS